MDEQPGWERNLLEKLALASLEEQKRARHWKLFFRLIWLLIAVVVIFSMMFGRADDSSNSGFPSGGPHTAVVDLTDIIDSQQNNTASLIEGMEAAYEDQNTRAIIIRANSPGGSPVVSNIAFNEIRRLKAEHQDIPLYVVAEDMCASGCYYIAAAADKIYADPSSIVGSIGVIGGGFDFTGLMDKVGIKRRLKTAGSNKGMGDPFTPETPEQQAIWEKMLADIHQEFIKAVKLGRGERISEQKTPDIFSGRIYTGNEAKQVGLIDDYGNVYSVARDVIKAPELVDYTPEDRLSSLLGRRLRAEVEAKVQETLDKPW